MDRELTQEQVRELFDYEDGKLIWKARPKDHFPTTRSWKTWNSRFAGVVAGRHRPDGYCVTNIKPRIHKNHRLIFLMHHGYLPKQIDHINGDRADNRIKNLRAATNATNQYNAKLRSDSLSGVKHVRWHKRTGKWAVRMTVDGVKKSCGYYDTLNAAKQAAELARSKFHKEFANHG